MFDVIRNNGSSFLNEGFSLCEFKKFQRRLGECSANLQRAEQMSPVH